MSQIVTVELERIAQACHEANRVWCLALGDASQPHWEDAPQWQKDSAIAGVKAHVDSGLTMTPEQSHESWLAVKKAEGWKYGPIKDADKKEHPCFVPYAALPYEQRKKDAIFLAVVHAMATEAA